MEEINDDMTTIVDKLFGNDLNDKGFRLIKQEKYFRNLQAFYKRNDENIKERDGLLKELMVNFREVSWNICIANNEIDLIQMLIDQMIHIDKFYIDYHKTLTECLEMIVNVIDIKREHIEMLYQSLTKHFNYNIITNDILITHLKCLSILYGESSALSNNTPNANPKNFFYFNGGQGHIVSPCITHMSIKEGFTFSLWFYISLDKSMLDRFAQTHSTALTTLIEIKCENGQSFTIFLDKMDLWLKTGKYEERLRFLSPNQWLHFTCIIKPRKTTGSTLTYMLNSSTSNSIPLNEFNCSNSIISMVMFSNFVGKSTSMMFIDEGVQVDVIGALNTLFPQGLWNRKKVKEFISYSMNSNRNDSDRIISKQSLMSLLYSHLKICYVPYQCKCDLIEDLCSNINGQIFYTSTSKGEEGDCYSNIIGVCNTYSLSSSIDFLGGINALLPIAEQMLIISNSSSSSLKLTPELLEMYLNIIFIIYDNNKTSNIKSSFASNFIASLSLFLEKLPSKLYTSIICSKLLQTTTTLMPKKTFDHNEIAESFICCLLFNEAIFLKFSLESQLSIWGFLSQYTDFTRQMFIHNKEFLPIARICRLLRYYDSHNSSTYCCKEHKEMFIDEDDTMEIVDIKDIIGKMMEIIEGALEEYSQRNYIMGALVKMMVFDMSPCLQKTIIGIVIRYLNKDIQSKIRMTSADRLIKHKIIDVMMFVMSSALYDVRIEMMKLIVLFVNKYAQNFEEDDEVKIKLRTMIFFMKDNVFPNYMFLSKETNPDSVIVLPENYMIPEEEENDTVIIRNVEIDDEGRTTTTHNDYEIMKEPVLKREIRMIDNESNKETIFNFQDNSNATALIPTSINDEKKNDDQKYRRRTVKSKTINSKTIDSKTLMKQFNLEDSSQTKSSFNENDTEKELHPPKKKRQTLMTQCVKILKYPFNYASKSSFHNSSKKKENNPDKEDQFSNLKPITPTINTIEIKDNYFNTKPKEPVIPEHVASPYELAYNQLNINYTSSTKSLLHFYKQSTLFTLTHQMLDILCNWLIDPTTKQIINGYVLDIIMKYLSFTDISHVTIFIRNLNDILGASSDNSVILLSHPKFYDWFIEVMFQSFLIVHPNPGTEYNSFLNFFSEEQKEVLAKDLYNISLWFHSDLILKAPEQGKDKMNDILLIGSKYKTKYNNAKKFKVIIGKFIRVLLVELIKKFICVMNNQSMTFKATEYYYTIYNVVLICFEFMMFYNIENKHDFAKEASVEKSIYPDFLFSALSMFNESNDENISTMLFEIWSDSHMSIVILKLFNSFWLVNDLHSLLDDVLLRRHPIDHFKDQVKILTINQNVINPLNCNTTSISFIKIISGLYTTNLLLAQDLDEARIFISEYTQFLLYSIVASTAILPGDNNAYLLKEFQQVIAFGFCFLYDEYARNDDGKRPLYSNSIEVLFSIVIKILFASYEQSTAPQSHSHSKPNKILGFLSSSKSSKDKEMKKLIDLRKAPVVTLFLDYFVELTQSNTHIFDQAMVQLLYSKLNKLSNREFFLSPVIKNAFKENKDLRNDLKDFFNIELFEQRCSNRLFNIKRYHLCFVKAVNIDDFYSLSYYNEKSEIGMVVKKIGGFYKEELAKWVIMKGDIKKKRVRDYRNIKKGLYSWRGMWSDRLKYYDPMKGTNTTMLKYKTKNHYGNNFSRPLLVPIIDIDYYMPIFTNYDPKRLFNQSQVSCDDTHSMNKVSFDIYAILKEGNKEKDEKTTQSQKSQSKSISSLALQFTYPELKELYTSINDLSDDSITIPESFHLKSNKMFNCCYIKQSHHIKGTMELSTSSLIFTYNPRDFKDKDEDYDKERNTCFGSIFHSTNPQKNIDLTITIPYKEIKYFFKRTYFYKKSSIEIFTTTNKSYYFNFPTAVIRTKVVIDLMDLIEHKREIRKECKDIEQGQIIGYEVIDSKSQGSSSSKGFNSRVDDWQNWKLSTFDFILWLNICANRSFIDLFQYPVFPWVLAQYDQKSFYLGEHSTDCRDLTSPMGMLEITDESLKRKVEYISSYTDKYTSNEEDITEGESDLNKTDLYFYGSHYSTSMYVAHYLIRLFPFANILIELHGSNFDNADRLFFSVQNTFESASTHKMDVRELCPEFYYLPEMFININDFNLRNNKLDESTRDSKDADNVALPPYSENNPYNFIMQMRESLDNPYVSNTISQWIDLIFGYKQKGTEAQKAKNLYLPSSYDNFSIEALSLEEKNYYRHVADFGFTPHQLFYKELPTRKRSDFINQGAFLKQITQNDNNLKIYRNKAKPIEKQLMLKMKVLDNDKVIAVLNTNQYQYAQYKYGLVSLEGKYQVDQYTKKQLNNPSKGSISNGNDISSRIKDYKNESNSPIVIYCNGKIFAQGGYWDGRIVITCLSVLSLSSSENNPSTTYSIENQYDSSPVMALLLDKEERIAIAGSINGSTALYKVNEYDWRLEKMVFDHNKEITSLSISNELNMFGSSSKDGYVHLYTLPLAKMVRSIKMDDNSVYADNIFLSSSPLPSFVVYTNKTDQFKCYSINGELIGEVSEGHGMIMSPIVFHDYTFKEFIVSLLAYSYDLDRCMGLQMDILS